MKTLLLVAALLSLAACTGTQRAAMTDVLRDINQALVPIGALARGR
jgi:hypothetical protein